ncbi:MAG: dihydrofolate reductase [Spirochaetales bacterium]|nr:dihydrofolate reductase [Spirochaetales bacterium]
MKTQYYTATSLDGFIATPDHDLTWLTSLDSGEAGPPGYDQFIAGIGALVMGSATYEWMLRNHIFINPDTPQAWPYTQPCWVFTSKQREKVANADITFVSGDIRPVYAQIAKKFPGKNLWLVGGGELVGQFYDAGLLNELIITVAPVTLGAGAPLLPRFMKNPMRLTSVQMIGNVFAELRYEIESSRAPEAATTEK